MHELFEYVTITRLGEMFGVTRIKMGHRLVESACGSGTTRSIVRPRWQ